MSVLMTVIEVNFGVRQELLVADLARRYLQVGFDLFPGEVVRPHPVQDAAPTAAVVALFNGLFQARLAERLQPIGPCPILVKPIRRQEPLALATPLHAPSTDLPSPKVRIVYRRSRRRATPRIPPSPPGRIRLVSGRTDSCAVRRKSRMRCIRPEPGQHRRDADCLTPLCLVYS